MEHQRARHKCETGEEEEESWKRLHLLLGPSCSVSPTLLYCTANRVMHPRDKAGRRIYGGGGFSPVIERYAASSRYLFPPPPPPPLPRFLFHYSGGRRSSCQSNWLRRATKILRCSSPLRGHLRAGDINQCRVFRVPSLSLSSAHPLFTLSLSLSLPRFKVISTDAVTRADCNRLNLLSFLSFLPRSSKSKDRANLEFFDSDSISKRFIPSNV